MNWDAVGALAELVGALAVVLTLAYLAMQFRQNSKVAQAQSERDSISRWQVALVEFERAGIRLLSALEDPSKLDRDETHFYLSHLNEIAAAHYMIWRMYELEQISAQEMSGYDQVMCMMLSTPGGAAWWSHAKFAWDTRDYLDAALAKHDGTSWVDWHDNFYESLRSPST